MTKRHSAEEVINKLRQADVELSRGATIAGACKLIGISEQTYHRWRKEYGGLKVDQAQRFKELEKENARLKHLLDKAPHRRLGERPVARAVEKRLTLDAVGVRRVGGQFAVDRVVEEQFHGGSSGVRGWTGDQSWQVLPEFEQGQQHGAIDVRHFEGALFFPCPARCPGPRRS